MKRLSALVVVLVALAAAAVGVMFLFDAEPASRFVADPGTDPGTAAIDPAVTEPTGAPGSAPSDPRDASAPNPGAAPPPPDPSDAADPTAAPTVLERGPPATTLRGVVLAPSGEPVHGALVELFIVKAPAAT